MINGQRTVAYVCVIVVLFFICMIILKMWYLLIMLMSFTSQHIYFHLFVFRLLNLCNTIWFKLIITEKKSETSCTSVTPVVN